MKFSRGICRRACYAMPVLKKSIWCYLSLCGTEIAINYKKPQTQYNLYQECGFLYLISGCMVWPARVQEEALAHRREHRSPILLRLSYAILSTNRYPKILHKKRHFQYRLHQENIFSYAPPTRSSVLTQPIAATCYAPPKRCSHVTLSAYTRPTRCPVLTHRMVLSYDAMPGTELAYAATDVRACYAKSAYGTTPSEPYIPYHITLSGTDTAYGATSPYLLPTKVATPPTVLHACYAMSSTDIPPSLYHARIVLRDVQD
eukprot:2843557-Rhodomonas_salina.3